MANENKGFTFLPKTADAIFEYQGEVAFVAKANTSAAVTISQTKTEKRGGQDNVLIGTIFSDKTIEVSITAASWMPEFLAAEVGSPIKIGGYEFISNDLNIVATEKASDIVVELPGVPVDKVIHLKRADGTYVKVPATGTTVSIKEFGFNKGDCVSALGLFDYKGKRIDLSTSTSPMVGKLTLTSPIFKSSVGKVGKSEYVFPIFQFDGNFTHTYSADATYELKGNPLATDSGDCGNGDSYGYYQEYMEDEALLTSYSTIIATPSVVELKADGNETETLAVYGKKSALYDRVLLENSDSKLTFTSDKDNVATVATGVITAVAQGEANITVKYNNSLTSTVKVVVV